MTAAPVSSKNDTAAPLTDPAKRNPRVGEIGEVRMTPCGFWTSCDLPSGGGSTAPEGSSFPDSEGSLAPGAPAVDISSIHQRTSNSVSVVVDVFPSVADARLGL